MDRCVSEKNLQFTYLIIYNIFTFKVWSENNLHRVKVLFCATGFCKETNEQSMKTFSWFYLNNMQQTETRI